MSSTYRDGAPDDITEIGTPFLQYPFLTRGIRDDVYIIVQPVAVRYGGHALTPFGTAYSGTLPNAADSTKTHYLVDETEPIQRGAYSYWQRIYAPSWADIVYLDFTTYNKPSLLGLTYSSKTPSEDANTGGQFLGSSLVALESAVQTTIGSDTPIAALNDGTFKIGLDGNLSTAIAWDATASTIQTAIRAITGAPAHALVRERNAPTITIDDPTAASGSGQAPDGSGGDLGSVGWNIVAYTDAYDGTAVDLDITLTADSAVVTNGNVRFIFGDTGDELVPLPFDTNDADATSKTNSYIAPVQTIPVYAKYDGGDNEKRSIGTFTITTTQSGNTNNFEIVLGYGEDDATVTIDPAALEPSGAGADLQNITRTLADVPEIFGYASSYIVNVDGDDTPVLNYPVTATALASAINALATTTGAEITIRALSTDGNGHMTRGQIIPKELYGSFGGESDQRAWYVANTTLRNSANTADYGTVTTGSLDITVQKITFTSDLLQFSITSHGLSSGDDVWAKRTATSLLEKVEVSVSDANTLFIPTSDALQTAANDGAITLLADTITLTDTAHGLSTGDSISFYTSDKAFIARKTITVSDADTYTITGLTAAQFGSTYSQYSAEGVYFTGNQRLRARFTVKSYQPGTLAIPGEPAGATRQQSIESIPFETLDDKPFDVLQALIDGTETISVASRGIEYLFGNLLIVTNIEVFTADLLQ